MSLFPFSILLEEPAGIIRKNEPVTVGFPLSQGQLSDIGQLCFTLADGSIADHDGVALSRWPDGSVQWACIDLQVNAGAGAVVEVIVTDKGRGTAPVRRLRIDDRLEEICINTGEFIFVLAKQGALTLSSLNRSSSGKMIHMGSASIRLTMMDQAEWEPVIDTWTVEHRTALKATFFIKGHFVCRDRRNGLGYEARTSFFAGKSVACVEFTLINPLAAIHKGGAWDLGDPNSICFKDLRVCFTGRHDTCKQRFLLPTSESIPFKGDANVGLFQASSGSTAWDSSNHVNREGRVPLQFKGFQVYEGGSLVRTGEHASPTAAIHCDPLWMVCRLEEFWQNFPKAVDVNEGSIHVKFFPDNHNDGFEIQPGEQKTHKVFWAFDQTPDRVLDWVDAPLIPVIPPRIFSHMITLPWSDTVESEAYDQMVGQCLDSVRGFETKKSVIDEFGWRNFGDIWADHESVMSEIPLISHYNNQYDVIKGMIVQLMRTGDTRWFTLARQMADHVVDIDIYHTDLDKWQYNRGMFWHTDHHLDASTATHRTISRDHKVLKPSGSFGGGPAPDHNYATGLVYLYWLTGNPRYRGAVIELASNILACFNAPHTLCELGTGFVKRCISITRSVMKRSSSVDILRFNGPSRVSGNSLTTLMDAFLLTGEDRYLKTAEQLIVNCVSPEDDCNRMKLSDSENRWMYLVFLNSLSRYLEIKNLFGQHDAVFQYAINVMSHYAGWMVQNESPFLDRPEELEFPTETWAAQDLRKADILASAATWTSASHAKEFEDAARFYFNHSLEELKTFDTKHFTRPMAILLSNSMLFLKLMSSPRKYVGSPGALNIPCRRLPRTGVFEKFFRIMRHFSLQREVAWIQLQLKSR